MNCAVRRWAWVGLVALLAPACGGDEGDEDGVARVLPGEDGAFEADAQADGAIADATPEDASPPDVVPEDAAPEDDAPIDPIDHAVSFRADIAPLLARSCTGCHRSSFRGDFRSAEGAYAALTDPNRSVGRICNDGETPILPVVTPGDPTQSGLWWLVGEGYGGCARPYGMPKGNARGILADFDPRGAALIHAWIGQGAVLD